MTQSTLFKTAEQATKRTTNPMRVLDLFAGLKGWSEPFRERGHETFSIDLNRKFDVDMHIDILNLQPDQLPWFPDIVLASPPCEGFSVMQIGRNWHGSGCADDCSNCVEHAPKTEKAVLAMSLVQKTLELIDILEPTFFVIENPRAKLRKLPMMQKFDLRTVTYCKYGERRMKPTDLWGGFPPALQLHPICKNGDPCHIAAPRGSTTGSQGMDSAESAKIPRLLALDVCLTAESYFEGR